MPEQGGQPADAFRSGICPFCNIDKCSDIIEPAVLCDAAGRGFTEMIARRKWPKRGLCIFFFCVRVETVFVFVFRQLNRRGEQNAHTLELIAQICYVCRISNE